MLLIVCRAQIASAGCITVAWDASPDPTVVGYNLYYGDASSAATNKVQVGNVTSGSICSLEDGKTYGIYITSVNAAGLESARTPVMAYNCQSSPNIIVTKPAFSVGETIVANFGGAAGNR